VCVYVYAYMLTLNMRVSVCIGLLAHIYEPA